MMTNRLLSVVIAVALTTGIVAHAAQAPQRPLVSLPALQTAASHVTETATGAIDPGAAIRAGYLRNQVALAHLRQQASPLKSSARLAFYQFISDQEAALAQTERTALATSRPASSSTIAAMDKLVAAAERELNQEFSQADGANSNSSKQGAHSQSNGQSDISGQSGKPGQSDKSGQAGNSQGGDN